MIKKIFIYISGAETKHESEKIEWSYEMEELKTSSKKFTSLHHKLRVKDK